MDRILENGGTGAISSEFIRNGRPEITISGTWGGATVQLQVNPRDNDDTWVDSVDDVFDETSNTGIFRSSDSSSKLRFVVVGGDATTSLDIDISNIKVL